MAASFLDFICSWSSILIILITTTIIHFYRKMTYFKRAGIPHESGIPIFGNMLPVFLQKEHILHLFQRVYEKHPDAKYVGLFDFGTPIIIIRDPDLITSIGIKNFDTFVDHRNNFGVDDDDLISKSLITLRGDKWKEARSVLSPSFTGSKMKIMFGLLTNCTDNFITQLADETEHDLDAKLTFAKFTTDVIGSCVFGVSVDSMKNPDNEFFRFGANVMKFTYLALLKMFFLTKISPKIGKLLGFTLLDKNVVDRFKVTLSEILETRKKENIVRPDMIQLMMDAGHKLTVEEMMAQAIVFFFGGFDSTSTMISFVTVELAANLDVQKELQNEIDETWIKSDGNITYELINSMKYLDAVVNETLRMYPIITFVDRVCNREFELPPVLPGAPTYKLKPGDNVWFPASGIHKDPKYYPNPNKFDPTRFLNQKIKGHNDPLMLTFGIGPRSCIASRFAIMTIKVLIFYLLKRFNLKISSKTQLPLELDNKSMQPMPKGGFWIKLEDRICNKA